MAKRIAKRETLTEQIATWRRKETNTTPKRTGNSPPLTPVSSSSDFTYHIKADGTREIFSPKSDDNEETLRVF